MPAMKAMKKMKAMEAIEKKPAALAAKAMRAMKAMKSAKKRPAPHTAAKKKPAAVSDNASTAVLDDPVLIVFVPHIRMQDVLNAAREAAGGSRLEMIIVPASFMDKTLKEVVIEERRR